MNEVNFIYKFPLPSATVQCSFVHGCAAVPAARKELTEQIGSSPASSPPRVVQLAFALQRWPTRRVVIEIIGRRRIMIDCGDATDAWTDSAVDFAAYRTTLGGRGDLAANMVALPTHAARRVVRNRRNEPLQRLSIAKSYPSTHACRLDATVAR